MLGHEYLTCRRRRVNMEESPAENEFWEEMLQERQEMDALDDLLERSLSSRA